MVATFHDFHYVFLPQSTRTQHASIDSSLGLGLRLRLVLLPSLCLNPSPSLCLSPSPQGYPCPYSILYLLLAFFPATSCRNALAPVSDDAASIIAPYLFVW